ncbi:hypothetical protein PV04_05911 [Phialophora macrospora]|uniref:CENP-V/GFA domain-containing protein n=1 Tax=Phialophora macrospora TaxID=1851006 RepID=A0A0D2FEY8_9EURO|nr:hypothetical protein PV04_05911 [Phialophora macrospora]
MTTIVEVTCLCGRNAEEVQLNSRLPVPSAPCSCNICRYSTGVLYFSDLPLTSRPDVADGLCKYDSSSKLSRYFCPNCGSPMFVELHGDSSCDVHGDHTWSVNSGVVDRIDGQEPGTDLSLERIMQHEFVGDTKDGGLVCCLDQIDGRLIPFLLQGPDGAKLEGPAAELFKGLQQADPAETKDHQERYTKETENRDELYAECHCGGVNFRVTRPNMASKDCSSPWPDLVVPYHSSSSENREDVKWWLRENDTKYLAGTCACRSCRLGSGSPIQAWAFIPKANILQSDGNPLRYDMGSLQHIESSSGRYREFCSICGATVFWHDLERPDVVDVSVGLLRAPEGARASSWLDWWTEKVSFKEEAFDKKLINHLEKGLQNIRLQS